MPFAAALGLRVLDHVEREAAALARTAERARTLADGIRASLAELDLRYAVVQLESIVDFKFRSGPATRSYDDQARADQAAFAAFYHAARDRGVLLPPSHNEVMFLSTAHGDEDSRRAVAAFDASLRELRSKGTI